MRYSRFDERSGLYDVFEDGRQHALNADLPVPQLPAPDQGIGVAARFAGRPLPSRARHIGRSFRPVGVIVPSERPGALGDVRGFVREHPVVLLGAVGLFAYGAFRLYVSEMQAWGDR